MASRKTHMTTEEIEQALTKLGIAVPQHYRFESINGGFHLIGPPGRQVNVQVLDSASAARVAFGLDLIEVFPEVLKILKQHVKKPNLELSPAAKLMDRHWGEQAATAEQRSTPRKRQSIVDEDSEAGHEIRRFLLENRSAITRG
ncbi:hypothetical protein HYW58_01455 [Candidatus Kaiserbacteria bacterium]|nr:hypothetical protein [Candidatus Kaiserbacteria bacterium]